jgi:predicted outer membrane repeat protein
VGGIILKKYFLIIIFVLFLGLIVAGSATAATDVNPGNGTLKKDISTAKTVVIGDGTKVSSGKVITVNPGRGTLKKAIENAAYFDTLKLTTGTYYDHDIKIDKGLTIIGPEHTGTPTAVIDAEQEGGVFYIEPRRSRMYVFLKNIAITNGYPDRWSGGGILNNGGSLTMTDCSVSGNTSKYHGGGIYNGGLLIDGSLSMRDCRVSGNTSNHGGGIYNDGDEVFMTSCSVSGNTAESGYGGGIYNKGRLTMKGCDVKYNTARLGGGIYNFGGSKYNNGGSLTMTDLCHVNNNYTTQYGYGGGIYNDGRLTMTDCNANLNTSSYYGGGIYNKYVMTMKGCDVKYNTARYGYGGGIYNNYGMGMNGCDVNKNTAEYGYGGGIYNNNDLTMSTCDVIGNTAQNDYYGGGIYNNNRLTMSDCNVKINYTSYYGYGGGIYNNHIMTMNRCIVDNNVAGHGGGIYNYGHVYVDQYTRIFNNHPDNVAGNPLELGPSGGDDNGNGKWRAVNSVSATNIPMQKTGLPLIGLVFAMLLILGGLYRRN